MKLIRKGSVKNLYKNSKGHLCFIFSDRYSVFDWGEMPDPISNKGKTLTLMGEALFAYLENPKMWQSLKCPSFVNQEFFQRLMNTGAGLRLKEKGCAHNFLYNINREGVEPSHVDLASGFAVSEVAIPTVTAPGEVAQFYQKRPVQTLVPLEVIFRFGVPGGSSFTKRESYADFNLSSPPQEGDLFSMPLIDFSTKLESSDRILRYQEAQQIAGLNEKEFAELKDLTQLIALALYQYFKRYEIELWDGKVEFGFCGDEGQRHFLLVDSIGPDELRLLYKERQLSKEYLRQYLRTTHWYQQITDMKKKYPQDWQKRCREEDILPPHLPDKVKNSVEIIYEQMKQIALQANKEDVISHLERLL